MTTHYPRILSIAGSDSGGGAGIQADLKTCSALGCYGMTAITAITAQNTCGVQGIHAIPPEMLRQQIDAVVSDIGVDAVKIGMLHDPEVVHIVAQAIRQYRFKHIVLDPVMVATSGDALIARETIAVLVDELFPLVSVITPNLDEASLLLARPIQYVNELNIAQLGCTRSAAQRRAFGRTTRRCASDRCVAVRAGWRDAHTNLHQPTHHQSQHPRHRLYTVISNCLLFGFG